MKKKNAFTAGVIVCVIFSIMVSMFIFSQLEQACEKEHNVYDCEWVRTPYQPASLDNQ